MNKEDNEWLSGRPEIIRNMYSKYPPNSIYRLLTTGQIVGLVSYFENGTVKVEVLSDIVPVHVFGVDPKDLENTGVTFQEFISYEDVLAWAIRQRWQ